jgi:hypothetical protein
MMIMELKNFRKEYLILEKKYKLPSFRSMNEEFEIDKIERESDCMLRLIRKAMIEKIVNSLSFLEMLLNPANSPRIYMPYLKNMTVEDREIIEKIYSALADLSLSSLLLEVEYSEKGEAELIKKIYSVWNSNKSDFKKIIINVKNPKTIVRKEKSYFG